jgi:peroxiredoxin Q/BCP
MKFPTLLVLAASFAAVSPAAAAELQVGDNAPPVIGITETGAPLQFRDFYGRQEYTLVYFYPKAFTKGCTDQGCSLRDAYEELTAKGIGVIGVSLDTVDEQRRFKEEHGLPFTLIADTEKAVVNAFGVPAARVAQRSAYLIKDGKVIYADYQGTTTEQAAVILRFIADTQG